MPADDTKSLIMTAAAVLHWLRDCSNLLNCSLAGRVRASWAWVVLQQHKLDYHGMIGMVDASREGIIRVQKEKFC